MSKDEVELGGGDAGEDYEVVPVGPIRKLERRIDEIETKGTGGSADDELIRDVLDIMKSNQKIVNDMTESTHELKNSVEDLTHKMDSVIDNMNSFMDLLEEASEADLEGEVINDVHSRIADAVGTEMQDVAEDIKNSNKEVVSNLQDLNKSIKRSYTAQSKEETLSKKNLGRNNTSNSADNTGQPQGGSQQRKRNGQGRGSQGLDINRGNNSGGRNNSRRSQGGNSQNRGSQRGGKESDRMRKLKERFDKMDDEQ